MDIYTENYKNIFTIDFLTIFTIDFLIIFTYDFINAKPPAKLIDNDIRNSINAFAFPP